MINTDRLVLCAIYLVFSAGVFLIFYYFPHDIRLERNKLSFKERVGLKIDEITRKFKASTLMINLRNERIDRAVYEDLSYLRNLIIAHKGEVSSDAVISSLASREGILKKSYIRMLSFLRTGRVKEAENSFRIQTGTDMGGELGSLLVNWEQIPPEHLEEIIVSYRRSIKETNLTRQKKREEIISDLVYLPATLNVFLIFINFVYISYFMQQKEMFEMIF